MQATKPNQDRKKYSNLPIRTYLVLINLVMFCLLLPILSLFFWNKASQFKQDELDNSINTIQTSLKTRGTSLLSNLAFSTNQAIASFDFSNLNLIISQVTSADNDIQYCLVMDQQGVAIAHSQDDQVGIHLDDVYTRQTRVMMDTVFAKTIDSNAPRPVRFLHQATNTASDTMEAVTPVYNGERLWGALRCGYTLQSLHEQIKTIETKWQQEKTDFTITFTLLVILFLALGISITFYFTHLVSRAVKLLKNSVNEVANGNLEHQVSSQHLLCTEFDSLATNINKMTANLYESRQQLDKYSNSLEALVAERTQELEAANKELESFSYSVSHDLRAPLRSIEGFSKILFEDYYGQLGEHGNDCLKRVRKNTQHMQDLIDSLLTLSRVTRSPLKLEVIDVSQYAQDLLEQLHKGEPDRKLDLHITDKLTIHSDANLLSIVLDNLIGNAWKYTAKKPISKIEVGSELREGLTVFYVRDNGAGFDMQQADRLFGAFQRLHKEADFAGTGIGLATVQRIINRLGGLIWAESELDNGASFYFTLPQKLPRKMTSTGFEDSA